MVNKSIRKDSGSRPGLTLAGCDLLSFNRITLNNRSKIFQMAATVYEKEICSANILSCSGPPTDPKIGKRP